MNSQQKRVTSIKKSGIDPEVFDAFQGWLEEQSEATKESFHAFASENYSFIECFLYARFLGYVGNILACEGWIKAHYPKPDHRKMLLMEIEEMREDIRKLRDDIENCAVKRDSGVARIAAQPWRCPRYRRRKRKRSRSDSGPSIGLTERFPDCFDAAYAAVMRAKLGLLQVDDDDPALVADVLQRLAADRVDYTVFFRELCGAVEDPVADARLAALFEDPRTFHTWGTSWRRRLLVDDIAPTARAAAMRRANQWDVLTAAANFSVIEVLPDELPRILMVGRYLDTLQRAEGEWRFSERRCVFDSLLVPNSIIYPV